MSSSNGARSVLRRFFLTLTRVAPTKEFRGVLEQFIVMQLHLLGVLMAEGDRKKPSRQYQNACENLLARIDEMPAGELEKITGPELDALDAITRMLVKAMRGKPVRGHIDAESFVALNKRIFVRPGRRGPKGKPLFDDAYERNLKGESAREIARDLDPAYDERDPTPSLEKFAKAFARRRRAGRNSPKNTSSDIRIQM